MIYDQFFADSLKRLHDEQRYRVFIEIERIAGQCPFAIWRSPSEPRKIVMWCSNDYLGMSQQGHRSIDRDGEKDRDRRRRHPQYRRHKFSTG
jgi:7-keto-8-aminopelargonate synthetase-like enzyme